ncbi:MAG: ketol-acid reductoisomerase, partial [Planctomycetales bacterium]|nr:ketol-acid reductoisomerase [Planctomycetales bacterium]
MQLIYEKDICSKPLNDAKVAVVGFGAQGQAQSLNLKDSGLNVTIALRQSSLSFKEVEKHNLIAK